MKITVIGELCKDVFIYGDSKRLSPEAPVPVFNPKFKIENQGMAGNVVENIKSLSPKTKINFYHQNKEITKTRYVDYKSNHMFLRVDDGEENVDKLILTKNLIDRIQQSDAVILSDYEKGFLTYENIREICSHSKLSIMDTKKKIDSDLIDCFDFIKLNESEFQNNNIDIKQLNKIIITLGSVGAKYMNVIYPSPDPKETIDVSGAGDTFTAAFTLKYLENGDIGESIVYGNKMASIVVSKRGVTTPL